MSFAWNEFYSYSPLNMHNTFKMVSNDENLRKWFKLELKLNAYSRLTILQKKSSPSSFWSILYSKLINPF